MFEKIKVYLEMIKFEHTIFALPFAYIAVLLVPHMALRSEDILWITLAMISGRTTAMALNRIIDRVIDARNQRTKDRALPKGLIKVNEVWLYTVVFITTFFLSAYQLTPLAWKLSPLCLAAFIFYPYTKRFTWLSHFVLGFTLGLAPLCAWIAIANSVSSGIIMLSLGVAFWVTGFDIIYACADYEFDREAKLFSIPASFGIERALKISSLLHVFSAICFVLTGMILQLGFWYWIGLAAAMILMYRQHSMVTSSDLSHISFAFFNLNGVLSCVMFLATFVDVMANYIFKI